MTHLRTSPAVTSRSEVLLFDRCGPWARLRVLTRTRPRAARFWLLPPTPVRGDVVAFFPAASMNTSDSEEDSYNERSALVPSANPVVPSYRPGPDLSPPTAQPSEQVTFR